MHTRYWGGGCEPVLSEESLYYYRNLTDIFPNIVREQGLAPVRGDAAPAPAPDSYMPPCVATEEIGRSVDT